MINHFLPPPLWFKTALEVIKWAKLKKRVDDFLLDCKLRPYYLGESYSYRVDVMQELVRIGVVDIADDTLILGMSFDVEWLVSGLRSGNKMAWELVTSLDNEKAIEKKFDATELKRIGDLGENFVVDSLKIIHTIELHDQIKHVARYDDTFGYDIVAPSTIDTDKSSYLEVKTSVRPVTDSIQFFLSRNEFEVGKSLRNWCIVLVSIIDNTPVILGHLYCYQFESRIPKDIDTNVSWQTCKVTIECSLLRHGLP
jgi:hypothetical protein